MGASKATIAISIIGPIAIILGLTTGLLWSKITNDIITNELILSPTSVSFSMWKETPLPMYLKLYLFNWTNPEDFHSASGQKPHFVEAGPYVFREIDYKSNRAWNDNNGTVTFQQKRVWHFVESMSNGKLTDQITNLNPVAASVAYIMRFKNKMTKIIINSGMKLTGEKLTITKSVRELLFDGYQDELLKWALKLNSTLIPFDKFGWFYGRNESVTYDGTFNMATGRDNINDLGMLKEWNYLNKSNHYSDKCDPITGSLGDLWPTLKDINAIKLFAPDVCTSLSLVYNNATEFLGLEGNEYISDKYMLDNGTNVPSRACYCDNIECQPSGTLNVSRCKFNAPAFVSLPHFYMADESYRSSINGMNPQMEKHRFKIVVEPNLGIPMQVRARLQINLLVQPDAEITLFKNVSKTFIPMLWFSQEADLSTSIANQIKFILILPLLGHVTFFVIMGIGFLLVAIGIGLWVRRMRGADDGQSLISKIETRSGDGING